LFENKQFAEHEFARRNQEYPDKDRKLRPLIFGDTTPPAAQPAPTVQEPTWSWECNECGSKEFTSNVSESDLDFLACAGCGCNEFHKAYTTPPNVATPLAAQPAVPLTDEQWLDYLLKNASVSVVSIAAFIGESLQTRGRWVLRKDANDLRKLVEAAHGITEQKGGKA
jgi:hypothetical protein